VKSQNKEKISGGDIKRLFCKRQPKEEIKRKNKEGLQILDKE